jgi:hypothetical protein
MIGHDGLATRPRVGNIARPKVRARRPGGGRNDRFTMALSYRKAGGGGRLVLLSAGIDRPPVAHRDQRLRHHRAPVLQHRFYPSPGVGVASVPHARDDVHWLGLPPGHSRAHRRVPGPSHGSDKGRHRGDRLCCCSRALLPCRRGLWLGACIDVLCDGGCTRTSART